MADYRELLRRAIAALPENNGAARRAVYEKARSSLVTQLRGIRPHLPARDITQHRLQLEDCIHQVEREASEARILLNSQPDMSNFDPIKALEELSNEVLTSVALPPSVAVQPTDSASRSLAGTDPSPRTPQSISGIIEVASTQATAVAAPNENKPSAKRKLGRARKVAEPREYIVRPTVFLPPKGEQETDFASAMMPFSDDFDLVYRSIRSAVRSVGWNVGRADSIWEDQVIIQDIFGLIFRSRVVICDFSTKNPNVLYEAGIAHTLGRDVVPIVQQLSDLPFDLKHHRVLVYENSQKGRAKLRKELIKRLEYLKSRPDGEPSP